MHWRIQRDRSRGREKLDRTVALLATFQPLLRCLVTTLHIFKDLTVEPLYNKTAYNTIYLIFIMHTLLAWKKLAVLYITFVISDNSLFLCSLDTTFTVPCKAGAGCSCSEHKASWLAYKFVQQSSLTLNTAMPENYTNGNRNGLVSGYMES